MKIFKKFVIITAIVICSISLSHQESKGEATEEMEPDRIICNCTLMGKCKADGGGSVCAQSEPGGTSIVMTTTVIVDNKEMAVNIDGHFFINLLI